MTYVLAIDAGTTGVRAIVFTAGAESAGSAYRELPTRFPRPGWAEQDAEQAWEITRTVIAQALARAQVAPAAIGAVAIANQRSSVVAWHSRTGAALSPMILWHDVRTIDRCQQLCSEGWFVTPNMAASKAEWLVGHVEAVRDAAATGTLRLGGMESWLCAKLTGGAHVCDHANASATGFYAHLERSWDGNVLQAVSIDPAWLPVLVDSSSVYADTDVETFGAEVPVASMCGDQQASLYGLGCTGTGQTKCSYGTAAMVDACTGDALALGGPGTYPLVAWQIDDQPSYCIEGKVDTAGAAIQWLRDGMQIVSQADETAALAASVDDSGGVWAVPAFQGLGTPFMEARARAVLGGLSRGSTKAHVVRALLEGIAHRVADAAESVWQGVARPAVLRSDGGASRNDFLMQTQADLLGMTVERSAESNGAALGVAMLAARAARVWPERDDDGWRADRTFEPRLGEEARAEARAVWTRRLEMVSRELA